MSSVVKSESYTLGTYPAIFFNSESAIFATLNRVSEAATIKWIRTSEGGKNPPAMNFTMPNFVCSSCSADGGFSPITRLKAYSLNPGGTVMFEAPEDCPAC